MGKQTIFSNLVDIFDCDEILEFVNVEEQWTYYTEWIKSIMG
ncbi:hypothetical protein [Clostridium tarantellae]|nr:hypothetical protein [Clostridium tarantellae]